MQVDGNGEYHKIVVSLCSGYWFSDIQAGDNAENFMDHTRFTTSFYRLIYAVIY